MGYNKISFADVTENASYSKAVTFVAAREITVGTGDGKFSPEGNLTRGQFLVMVMKAYGIAPEKDVMDNFSDAGDTYYTNYLAAAKRLGITAGVGDNRYEPEKAVTRQEMFTLLYKTLKAMGKLEQLEADKSLMSYKDADKAAVWAKEALTYFVGAGAMDGDGVYLNPEVVASRSQMAQVLYDMLKR